MKRNDVFIAKCVGYDYEGLGVVRYEGFVIFVKNLLVDEEAEIICTMVKKNYGYGRVLKLIKTSENRVFPVCDVYKMCGGCDLQHMNLIEQAGFKKWKVENCFRTIAKMDVLINETISSEKVFRYRNKVQVPVCFDDRLKMGFYKKRTNEIVEFNDCLVQSELSNEILKFIKENLVNYEYKTLVRHVLIKHTHFTNEVMVVIITKKMIDDINDFVLKLVNEFKEIKSIILNINSRGDNVILGDKEVVLFGEKIIQEKLCGLTFNISLKSFFQINPYQTEVLYQKVLELARIGKDEVVLDLYCGTGTIGMIAAKTAKKVIGIEVVASAVEDAKINAENNDIKNIEFYCMDAGHGASKIVNENIYVNVVIVDPPRKGLDNLTIESIIKICPEKIVYVSCDPSTLARDCKIFYENGYRTEIIQPLDMFPLTTHVETIALIQRVKS